MACDSPQILLVEDSLTQSMKVSALLEEAGFQVRACLSAEDALVEIAKAPPDMMIVDYYLPGLRGDELCRRIRMDLDARQIPILLFTVDDTQAMELRSLDSGADDYIPKSADSDILIARVRGLLRKGQESQAILGAAQVNLREICMLAVDDSPTYLEKIALELAEEGYRCEKASSGRECLEKVASRTFDCILLDLVMPEMDGIEVCRKISGMRREMEHPVAVLMLTAREGKDDLTRALEAGADDFVGKSSDMTVLKGRIRALLRRNFYLEENRRITEELKAKEIEAFRAQIEKQTAESRASMAQELEIKNQQLMATNKELEDFSYSISHDLRAPLRAIDGFSQMLLRDYAEKLDGQGQNYLGRVSEACHRMGEMIEELLNLGRVARAELSLTAIDMSELASEIAENLRRSEPRREVECAIQSGLTVAGDLSLIRNLLENLFENAWKYSRKTERAKVEFGLIQEPGRSVYFVKDNGAGFNMAYEGQLFKAFQRLHAASEFPGTGIGLATVARVVRRHGGAIWAQAAEGEGATFFFTLEPEKTPLALAG